MKTLNRVMGVLALIFGLMIFFSFVSVCRVTEAPADASSERHAARPNENACRTIGGIILSDTLKFASNREREITALSTLAIAVFTIVLAIASAFQYAALMQSVSEGSASAKTQARQTQEAISEAAKSAAAMESVAASLARNTEFLATSVATSQQIADRQKLVSEMQLRAYVNVVIGEGVIQDRSKQLHFQARPIMINSGATPAKRVVHRIRAGVLPVPLPPPESFVLLLPKDDGAGEVMVPPQQHRVISAATDLYCDDADVPAIRVGSGKALHVWGSVTYEDAFGVPRETQFCQILTRLPDGKTWGFYAANRNSAT